jgi:hypothetical protein
VEAAVMPIKPQANYTKGPWLARKGDTFNPRRTWGVVRILSPEEHGCDPEEGERTEVIAEICDTETDTGEADAKRIAAAVNACEGVSTERLEELGPGSLAREQARNRSLFETLQGNLAQARKALNLLDHHSSLSWIDFEGEEPGEPPHHIVIGANAYWLERASDVAEYLVTAPVAADTGLALFLENCEVDPGVPEYEAICAVLRATAPGEAS